MIFIASMFLIFVLLLVGNRIKRAISEANSVIKTAEYISGGKNYEALR